MDWHSERPAHIVQQREDLTYCAMCTLPYSAHIGRKREIVYDSMKVDFDEIMLNLRRDAYTLLGSGSGRDVYDIGGGHVAKVAINRRGLAQNEAEYQIFRRDDSDLFANIIAATSDLRITIMEKAEPLHHFSAVLRYYGVRNDRQLQNIPLIKRAIAKHSLLFPDLCRVQNWGVVDGRPVIIDYGFTTWVKRRFYSR